MGFLIHDNGMNEVSMVRAVGSAAPELTGMILGVFGESKGGFSRGKDAAQGPRAGAVGRVYY